MTIALWLVGLLAVLVFAAYGAYPWLCRRGVSGDERRGPMPGDEIVSCPSTGYTLAVTIQASPADVWPWLVQMGQGRAGFYTHEWVEGLLGAKIRNADRIVPELSRLAVGDVVRLTPDEYMGGRGQRLTVARIERGSALVLSQVLPNGSNGSWAFALRPRGTGTRLFFRRRGERPSAFDRIALPGYYYMDVGMLAGIKQRAERISAHPLRVAAAGAPGDERRGAAAGRG